MTRRNSESLIRDLAGGLRPVRPIPRLRAVVGAVASFAVVGAALVFWRRGGPRPDLASLATGDAIYAAIALGMAAIAVGGLVAGLASCVPGRERDGWRALMLAGVGAALALVIAPMGVAVTHVEALRSPVAGDLGCLVAGLAAAAFAVAASLYFGWRTAPRSLALAAALAAAGAGAIGGIAVHSACPSPHALHWLWGHAAVPVVAALLTLGAGSALRRK